MADVFISYAKTDRPLASKLAAMLEAEGWKVRWDTSLTIGDDFRNEIMIELGRARAVIAIWTDASIKSDWVRSEAGRAQADRKLIPLKLPNLTYKDLPPPFDVLHTENIGEGWIHREGSRPVHRPPQGAKNISILNVSTYNSDSSSIHRTLRTSRCVSPSFQHTLPLDIFQRFLIFLRVNGDHYISDP